MKQIRTRNKYLHKKVITDPVTETHDEEFSNNDSETVKWYEEVSVYISYMI